MRQHDDAVVGLALLEVGGEPGELLVAQLGGGSETLSRAMKCTPLWSNV